ncbi:MAG: hypothetical protein BHW65_07775 [Verrucomicrobia bacterium CAG:312_58_20]|nr:MAG: hypothetical protein BHW65_07775 [Verrucomicrobia bacterium CAG:312_58_20]
MHGSLRSLFRSAAPFSRECGQLSISEYAAEAAREILRLHPAFIFCRLLPLSRQKNIASPAAGAPDESRYAL